MACCDLHTHSYYSDGSLSPAQLVRQAEAVGLGAIALTDHNTVDGLPEFLAAGQKSPVETIPGIEFSTEYQGTELHILALFLKSQNFAYVTGLMEDYLRRKEQSNVVLVEALCRAGYAIDYEEIKAATPEGHVNRAHIAEALTGKGYTPSVQEAFKTLLGVKCGFYVPPKRLDAFEAIRLIRDMGAVSVLAHPFLNLQMDELVRFLESAVSCGLCAMETLYGRYDRQTTQTGMALADRFCLKHSGGSDFHGSAKPDVALGSGRGDLAISMELLERLRPN